MPFGRCAAVVVGHRPACEKRLTSASKRGPTRVFSMCQGDTSRVGGLASVCAAPCRLKRPGASGAERGRLARGAALGAAEGARNGHGLASMRAPLTLSGASEPQSVVYLQRPERLGRGWSRSRSPDRARWLGGARGSIVAGLELLPWPKALELHSGTRDYHISPSDHRDNI